MSMNFAIKIFSELFSVINIVNKLMMQEIQGEGQGYVVSRVPNLEFLDFVPVAPFDFPRVELNK